MFFEGIVGYSITPECKRIVFHQTTSLSEVSLFRNLAVSNTETLTVTQHKTHIFFERLSQGDVTDY